VTPQNHLPEVVFYLKLSKNLIFTKNGHAVPIPRFFSLHSLHDPSPEWAYVIGY
jgi:hypothetical protein